MRTKDPKKQAQGRRDAEKQTEVSRIANLIAHYGNRENLSVEDARAGAIMAQFETARQLARLIAFLKWESTLSVED